MHTEILALVRTLDDVGRTCCPRNGDAVGEPLVGNATTGDTIHVTDIGCQCFANLRCTTDGNYAVARPRPRGRIVRVGTGIWGIAVADADTRRITDIAVIVSNGVSNGSRRSRKARLRGKGNFTVRTDRPGAFARYGQCFHTLTIGIKNIYAAGIQRVFPLRVSVIGQYINGYRPPNGSLRGISISDRFGTRRSRIGIRIRIWRGWGIATVI